VELEDMRMGIDEEVFRELFNKFEVELSCGSVLPKGGRTFSLFLFVI
jgi:hypothetical protein